MEKEMNLDKYKYDLGSCQYDKIGQVLDYAISNDLKPVELAKNLGIELTFFDIDSSLEGYGELIENLEIKNYEEITNISRAENIFLICQNSGFDLWSTAFLMLEFIKTDLDINNVKDDILTGIICYSLYYSGLITNIDYFSGFAT